MSPRIAPIVAAILACQPATAFAGMPSIQLNDVLQLSDLARLRLQSISFFLAGFLLSSWFIQFLWNRLRGDFASLPRLHYRQALGIVALWGLLFVLVLTMISGARELLTPGAWEKQGNTYRLSKEPAPPVVAPAVLLEQPRKQKLESLRAALWEYAENHDEQFPSDRAALPREKWQVPDASGMRYLYVSGRQADRGALPLAYEPGIFGSRRFVLFTSGEIKHLEVDEIVLALSREEP